MLLLYILLVLGYCYALDALISAVTHRRWRERVRALRTEVRANLASRGKRHV